MGTLVVQDLGGKDLAMTLALMVVVTDMGVATSQVLIPWMDLKDPAGEEKM